MLTTEDLKLNNLKLYACAVIIETLVTIFMFIFIMSLPTISLSTKSALAMLFFIILSEVIALIIYMIEYFSALINIKLLEKFKGCLVLGHNKVSKEGIQKDISNMKIMRKAIFIGIGMSFIMIIVVVITLFR